MKHCRIISCLSNHIKDIITVLLIGCKLEPCRLNFTEVSFISKSQRGKCKGELTFEEIIETFGRSDITIRNPSKQTPDSGICATC